MFEGGRRWQRLKPPWVLACNKLLNLLKNKGGKGGFQGGFCIFQGGFKVDILHENRQIDFQRWFKVVLLKTTLGDVF